MASRVGRAVVAFLEQIRPAGLRPRDMGSAPPDRQLGDFASICDCWRDSRRGQPERSPRTSFNVRDTTWPLCGRCPLLRCPSAVAWSTSAKGVDQQREVIDKIWRRSPSQLTRSCGGRRRRGWPVPACVGSDPDSVLVFSRSPHRVWDRAPSPGRTQPRSPPLCAVAPCAEPRARVANGAPRRSCSTMRSGSRRASSGRSGRSIGNVVISPPTCDLDGLADVEDAPGCCSSTSAPVTSTLRTGSCGERSSTGNVASKSRCAATRRARRCPAGTAELPGPSGGVHLPDALGNLAFGRSAS